MLIGLRSPDERERHQDQPGHSQDHGGLLAPREP